MLGEWASYRAGGMMVIMLLFGAGFAIGHHFFYLSLLGKPPPNVVYLGGFAGGLTGQQVNLAVGSIFAFLVNSALGAAIITAADQALWTTVRTEALELGAVDDLATATTNIWSMFSFRLWRRSLIRMILATIFWLLPVTSFITPATLNVGWSAATSILIARVPQVDFTSLNFASIDGQQGLSANYVYSEPQYSVLQAVAGSTTGGQILPISSPHINATWLLEFHGPALLCERINKNSTLYDNIKTNILTAMAAGSEGGECMRSFGYISWVPSFDTDTEDVSLLPFPGISLKNTAYKPPLKTLGPMIRDLTTNASDAVLALYLAALPGMVQGGDGVYCANPHNDSFPFLQFGLNQVTNMTVTSCTMYNTSYVANFTYINRIQSVKLATKSSYNNVRFLSGVGGAIPLEIGGTGSKSPTYNVPFVENFAYQAVMDAFGRMFVGTIAHEFRIDTEDGIATQAIDTQVASTPLLGTADFNFLQPLAMKGGMGGVESLLASVEDNKTAWNGLSVQQAPNSTIPAARVIEELFQNATISLMSMPMLQPNYSSPYAPPETAITLTKYTVLYSYAAQTLWLAYGITLGVTLLSILLGAVSIYYNGGFSYMTKFSTILRVAHCIDLSEAIRPEDTDGKDPTPPYIKNLTISFPPGSTVRYKKAAGVSETEHLQQSESI